MNNFSPPHSGVSSAAASTAPHLSLGSSSAHHMPSTPPAATAAATVSTASTEPFLRDFTLIAEAAKRAQMAILTRDMDGFSFS